MKQATRILLVDDEPVVLEFYAHLLRKDHYEVWTAATGAEGLRCARAQRPDLVLLDVMLPDMSGLEVCRQLKQDPSLPDVFVALNSGEAVSSEHKVDGLDSGADDYIVKPITPNELLARIRTLVRLRNTTAALRASERHFRRLVEILPDAVGLVDHLGRLRAVNPQARVMLGYSDDAELLERTIFDLTLPEDHERIRAETSQTLENLSRRNVEYTLRRKDGTTIPAELSLTTTTDAGGAPAGFVVVVRDISERKQAEVRRAAFSRLGELLSEASTSKEAAQIIVDIADQLLGWDSCHVRLFSSGPDQIVPILAYDEINGQRAECPVEGFSQDPTPMSRKVMEQGAQLVNNDDSAGDLPGLRAFGDTNRRSASRMFAPIRKGATRLGILSIQSYQSHAYTREDLQLLQALADHCGGALVRINIAESLQESESRFRSLFESAPFGLALHNARGHLIRTNRAYQEMLGYSEDELRQLGVKGITHPEDIAQGQRLFGELVARQRDFYRREKRYVGRDGRVVWAESSASVVEDAHGQLRFIVSMVDDITERKRAEAEIQRLNNNLEEQVRERTSQLQTANAALQEREQQLRLTLEASNAGTWSWEVATNHSTWDSSYHALYGFGPEDPVSFEAWISRVHPEDRERLLAQIQKFLPPGTDDTWNEEFRVLHPVKGERWMAGLGRVIRHLDGQLARMIGINLDITPRKRAEESVRRMNDELEQRVRERTSELEAANTALRESEVRKVAIMEAALDAIITLDETGHILEFNSAAEKMFGHNRARIFGQAFGEVILSPTIREWFGRGLACRFCGETGPALGSLLELNALRADGLGFPAEFTITRIGLAGPPQFTVFMRDLAVR